MHRQTLVALSWCLVIGIGIAVLLEVHRSHREPVSTPVVITATTTAATMPVAATMPRAIAALPPLETERILVVDEERTPQGAAHYSGNTNTHRFHAMSCRHASCRNCTASFETRQEAIDAGYRPCGVCDP